MLSLKKYYKLNASQADIYNALTNPVMIEIWTGEQTEFVAEPETDFLMWGGAITGKNVAFEKDKLVQQIWYFDDIESNVTIKLHPDKNETTSVELRQDNIPEEAFQNISDGWDEDYFGALEELFND